MLQYITSKETAIDFVLALVCGALSFCAFLFEPELQAWLVGVLS